MQILERDPAALLVVKRCPGRHLTDRLEARVENLADRILEVPLLPLENYVRVFGASPRGRVPVSLGRRRGGVAASARPPRGVVAHAVAGHVALETFPFGGSITTLDAFEGATPVVALAPQAGRPALTAALYAIMGVDGLVAATVDEYVDLAVSLANDPAKRAAASAAVTAGAAKLYEVDAAVREVEGFFERALRGAGLARVG